MDQAGSRSRAKPASDPLPHILAPNPGREALPHTQGREPPRQPSTHSMSPSWASCFSATCRSFWGSPSRSKRSFSPYRLPRPIVRFVLRRTRGQGHEPGHQPPAAETNPVQLAARAGARRVLQGTRAAALPVVLDLLLYLGHHHLLSFKEGSSDIVPIPQASLWGRERRIGVTSHAQHARKGTRDLLAASGPWAERGRQGDHRASLLASPCQSAAPLLVGFQAGTTCLPFCTPRLRHLPVKKTPGTTRTKLGKSSGAPVPNLGTSSLRGQQEESWDLALAS